MKYSINDLRILCEFISRVSSPIKRMTSVSTYHHCHHCVRIAVLSLNQEGETVSDEIEGLLVPPLLAEYSSEHIMGMSFRLRGPKYQPGARGISPRHFIKPKIN